MTILITGGAGYVGSHLCRQLRRRGIKHLILDDFSTGHACQLHGSPFVRADIGDPPALDRVFSEFRPDTVMHLAALATLGDCARRPQDAERINVWGTRTLLDAMVRHGVYNLVFASSCAVYTPTSAGTRLTEKLPLGPDTAYGKSKAAGEAMLKDYPEVKSASLRLFNVAGADPEGDIGEDHSPETHLLPLAIMTALGQRDRLEIFGNDYPSHDGTAVRDYVHASDVAAAFLLAGRYLKEGGEPVALNLGSGAATSVRELVAAVEKHTGKKIKAVETPRREGDAPWLVADNAAIRRTLGWQPEMSSLDTIVKTALAWHLRH